MWSARRGSTHPRGPGGWNPRTNDLYLDERGKTIPAPAEGERITEVEGGLDKHRGTDLLTCAMSTGDTHSCVATNRRPWVTAASTVRARASSRDGGRHSHLVELSATAPRPRAARCLPPAQSKSGIRPLRFPP
jgi:hypothetical protein